MAMKYIKRKSAVKPITGSIVDSTNIADKTTNTYSAEIIDGLVKVDDTDWVWLDQTVGILYRKKGDLVMLRFSSNKDITLEGWAWTQIATLPANIRPNYTMRFSVYSKGNSNIYGEIVADTGAVALFNWADATAFEAGQLSFTLTYFM